LAEELLVPGMIYVMAMSFFGFVVNITAMNRMIHRLMLKCLIIASHMAGRVLSRMSVDLVTTVVKLMRRLRVLLIVKPMPMIMGRWLTSLFFHRLLSLQLDY
jgi:hypothetical protein